MDREVFLITDTDEYRLGTAEAILSVNESGSNGSLLSVNDESRCFSLININKDSHDTARSILSEALRDIVSDLVFGDDDDESATISIELR